MIGKCLAIKYFNLASFDASPVSPIAPDASLPFCENFFHMVFGRVPAKEVIKAFDVSMILYAEHTFNASTFAARVVTSTMADIHGAIITDCP